MSHNDDKEINVPPITLEFKTIRKEGWSIKLLGQNEKEAVVKIYCTSEEFDWYSMTARIPKSKLKRLK
jgi:hypothetical protein